MKKHLAILFILSLFLFLWKINRIPILDGDTAFGATIAKNILKSGDWLTLRFMNPADLVPKPPLFYWLMAVGMKIFGVNEFGLSVFHSLIAALTVMLTYLIAKELYGEKTAFWSGLILLSSAQFFYAGRSPLQDMPLAFFIAAAFYCFILFEKNKNYLFYYLIPVFTAFAVLIKGPVGFFLIALVLFIYTAWNKSIMKYINFHLLLCLCLCLCLILPWFIVEYRILGQPFADIMISSNFGRFFHPTDIIGNDPTVNTAAPQYDFYSYILQLLILFVPWSGFLYPAIFAEMRKKENRLILSWIIGIIMFFSLSLNYKISRYILPVFPALSIITAKFLNGIKESKASNYIYGFLIAPFFIAASIYLSLNFPSKGIAYKPIIMPFLIILSIGILTGTILLFRKKLARTVFYFSLFALISYLVLIPCLDIYFKEANPIKEFCQTINKLSKDTDKIVLYKTMASNHFAGFYLNHPYVEIDKKEELEKLEKGRVFVISENTPIFGRVIAQRSGFVLFSNR